METIEPKERERIIRDQADRRLNESLATISKLEAENKELREAAQTLRAWLDPDVSESENETFLNDVIKIDQLLTKNEGL